MQLNKNKKIQIILCLILILSFLNGCASSNKLAQKNSFEEPHPAKDCSFDKYNCDDFATQKQAQKILEKCGYDLHQLDRDKDGKACE